MSNDCLNVLTVEGPADDVLAMYARVLPHDPVPFSPAPRCLHFHQPADDQKSGVAPAAAAALVTLAPSQLVLRSLPHITYLLAGEGTTRQPAETRTFGESTAAVTATAVWSFYSPWSPPVEWLCDLSKNFPTLQLRLLYYADSLPCAGWANFSGGAWAGDEYQDDARVDGIVSRM